MLKTPLCDLLGIDHPIIQAGMGPATSASLAAAVSNAGALGTIASFTRPAQDFRRQVDMMRDLTSRPFALNHALTLLDEESFEVSLTARPKLISFALADPGDYVRRAHDAGALVMHQVTTVAQARQAAERGADIIVAQGGEAGGYGGNIATLVLVPQVVDAVRPIPVVAAGGIFDGRGLAAALVLGAVGANIGTRFLASREAPVTGGYKHAIAAAASEDAVKFDAFNNIFPTWIAGGYDVVLRALKTPFIDQWRTKQDEARRERETLQRQLLAANQAGLMHEVLPTAGQSSGGIPDVQSAAEIVRRLVLDAEEALARAPQPI